MNAESRPHARVTHRFSAPPERVFDAWLDPELIGRWMFGPALRDEEVLRIVVDPRLGGSFSFVVRRQGEEIEHTGEYLEIDRPRRLVFTWGVPKYSPDKARVIVDIAPLQTGCELALTHELRPEWAEHVGQMEAAWTKMLDALDAALR